MYGTIFRMQPKPGQAQLVEDLFHQAERTRLPHIEGLAALYFLSSQSHPGELVGVAIFDSPASYQQNAADPAQGVWYRQLRTLLETDPDWNDGPFVALNREPRGL